MTSLPITLQTTWPAVGMVNRYGQQQQQNYTLGRKKK